MSLVDIEEASQLLRQGHVVAVPTETVWGLVARADDPKAVERLLGLKPGRQKPLSLFPEGIDAIERHAVLTEPARALILKGKVPGPVVMVLEARAGLNPAISPDNTVGIRLPEHETVLKLLQSTGLALASTSANPPDQEPAIGLDQVQKYFPDLPILRGKAHGQSPSTVVDLRKEPVVVLRRGPVSLPELHRLTGVTVVPGDHLRVLFVCTGGVDRSPAAARWLMSRSLPRVIADYLGTLWQTREIQAKCQWADLIFPLTQEHRDFLVDMGVDQHKLQEELGVPDPHGQDEQTRQVIFSFLETRLAEKVLPVVLRYTR